MSRLAPANWEDDAVVYLPWKKERLTPDGPDIKTSLTDEETAELVALARARRVLEVGSAFGWSACAMALGGAVHIVAVDLHASHVTNEHADDTLSVMSRNLEAYGVAGKVQVAQVTSQEALPALHNSGHRFGLIFIDGDHEREAVEHDVTWAVKLLESGGVLACHDYRNDNCPGVAEALDDIFPGGPTRLVNSLWVLET